MKKKIAIICAIVAVVISLTSLVAILLPSMAKEDKPEETTADTVDDGMITFTWYDEEYTVAEGTTYGQFFDSQVDNLNIDDEFPIRFNEDGYLCYYLDETVRCLGIPYDVPLQDGQAYGFDSYISFTVGKWDMYFPSYTFSCFNGATFTGLRYAGWLDNTQTTDISTLGDIFYNVYGGSNPSDIVEAGHEYYFD